MQSQHNIINSKEYPGTRQICINCDEPTGRCEDDGIWSEKLDGWICPDCACGSNTRNSIEELREIYDEMKSGNFDYDGRIPELAKQEVIDDIHELEKVV